MEESCMAVGRKRKKKLQNLEKCQYVAFLNQLNTKVLEGGKYVDKKALVIVYYGGPKDDDQKPSSDSNSQESKALLEPLNDFLKVIRP